MIEAVSLVDLTIRDVRLNDAAELAALTCELGYKTRAVEMATRLETVLKMRATKHLSRRSAENFVE